MADATEPELGSDDWVDERHKAVFGHSGGDEAESAFDLLKVFSEIQEVVPGVWLTSLDGAQHRARVAATGASHILSLGLPIQMPPVFAGDDELKLTYKIINIADDARSDLIGVIRPALTYMSEAVSTGSGVIVHCQAGVSRSSSVVIAYLMVDPAHRLSYAAAYETVLAARPIIEPNIGFLAQLAAFARQGARLPPPPDPDPDPDPAASQHPHTHPLIGLGYLLCRYHVLDYALVLKDLPLLSHKLTLAALVAAPAVFFVFALALPLASLAHAERAAFPKPHSDFPRPRFLTAEAQLRRRGSF
ncbi:uncharacterized protein AMSG_11690 [Thecamonas trahens ATCC 50062]|uniref:Protein-tyrosine-phosphatase n=1 Tax=Thecamonas trahens ATCC 50062 TaxID=461836 RepID=A0A0L0DVN9_THETB|nr:hypothetical protein AMSG_11690 [Thecamonas trahens ATCC 50062]KNC56141.1 hypothetical protein AMSG_11690 [Thecamonas trahens ATCC 50062]|eukprot:XP_013761229.1 hypothetical protein AMSG_11690 [Thecamonas trahens ATCC 50062]